MKIIIDRDSVCMGDDFGHQKTIECSEDETIESLIIKILQTDFFPVEDLKYLASKWDLKVNNNIIEDVTFDGEACVISISSTNILINLLIGKTKKEGKKK